MIANESKTKGGYFIRPVLNRTLWPSEERDVTPC